jgi:hypothetical protein
MVLAYYAEADKMRLGFRAETAGANKYYEPEILYILDASFAQPFAFGGLCSHSN